MTLEEYWDCTFLALSHEGGLGPQLIVDDGGDSTDSQGPLSIEQREPMGQSRFRKRRRGVYQKVTKENSRRKNLIFGHV